MFDIITPLKNGITEYMLKHNLRTMIDPISGNLAFRRGKRVFELVKKSKGGKPIQLVFLIYKEGEIVRYAVWKIKEDGAELIPYEIDMSKYTTFVTPYIDYNPSTIQSKPTLDEHIVIVETTYAQWGRTDIGEYGFHYGLICPTDDAGGVALIGNINCYQTPDYIDVDEKNYVYKGDNYYDMANYSNPGQEIAGSRQSFILWVENVINNLSSTFSYPHVYTDYDTKDGNVVEEEDWSRYIYAVLTPELYIGRDSVVTNSNITWRQEVIGTCCQTCGWETITNGYKYFFGSEILDYQGGSYSFCDKTDDYTLPNHHHCSGYSESRTNSNITILDYANKDIDSNFVCFFLNTFSGTTQSQDYTCDFPNDGYSDSKGGTIHSYYLAYKVLGGEVIKIKLAELVDGGWYMLPDASDIQYGFAGKRIRKLSCQATDEYLLYTYILQTFNGSQGGGTHFYDQDDVLWTFEKRVLGIINIKTGIKTEHIINDEILGNYATTFDETLASAIGLHKI